MVGDMEIQITDYNPVNRRIYEVGEKAYLDFDPHGVYIQVTCKSVSRKEKSFGYAFLRLYAFACRHEDPIAA